MGRFSFVRWSLLFLVLILAAACGNGKSDGSSGGSVDRTPPTVISTTPANGNLNVDVNTAISATFSEGMDPASLSTSTFTLADNAGYRNGAVSYNAATRVVSFIPAASLTPDTRYFVTITTGAKDAAGNALAQGSTWVFWTNSGSDAIPPSVVANSISPADGATNVPLSAHVTATFSESMDPASMDSFSFYLLEKNFSVVASTISYNDVTKVATLIPSQPLKDDTTYTVWVTHWATDKAGNSLSPEVTWTFRTVDKTSPEVLLVSPASGAGGVAATSAVSVTFSESVDGTTVNASTFKLTGPSGDVAGTIAYNDATRVATFTPANVLQDDSIYFAIVTTGVKDLAGNALASQMSWNFITRDTVGPFVAYMFPKAGAVSVQVDTSVTATFSEPIDPVTVNTRTLKVEDVTNVPAVQVPGLVTYNAQTQVATFAPFSDLTNATQYRATVTTDVRDNSGNQLQAPTSWTFTTSSAASGGSDTLSPSVASTSPAKNALNVAVSPGGNLISVTFTEAIDPSTLSGNMELEGSENVGLVSYDETSKTATFLATLNYGARYVIVVTTGVKDLAGNSLDVEVRWPFTTLDLAPPVVLSVSPADGAVQVPVGSVISVTFSEAMDPPSVTAAGTLFLLDDAGVVVPGNVAYDEATNTATFTSNNVLNADTTYLARVTLGATDLAGNLLAQEKLWGFRTVDSTPPTVLALSPADLAIAVRSDAFVDAVFSEPMAPATINDFTFTLTEVVTDVDVAGIVAYNAATRTATFMPWLSLDPLTQYKATLTTGITDSGSNPLAADVIWTFTTDTESSIRPPSVMAVTPANGAANVALNAAITATFSKPVDASTLTTDSFVLTDGNGNVAPGGVSYDAATATLTLLPDVALEADSFYVAQVLASVRDTEGVAMTRGHAWSFRTTAAAGVTMPAVAAVTPASGTLNVLEGSVLTVTFNKAMDPATINAATITLASAAGPVPGRVTYNTATDVATFTPLAVLLSNTYYTATVTTGVKDLSAQAPAAPEVWSFTTADSSPTVVSVTPLDKSTGFPVTGKIYVDFSEDMAPLTINATNIVMTGPGGPVAGTVSYTFSAGLYRATFSPNTTLSADSYYVMQVLTGAKDLSGNPLDRAKAWSFTTNALSDTTPPTVMSNIPWNGATHMSVVNKVSATFSEAMDTSSLAAAFTLFDVTNAQAVPGRIDYDNTTHVATFVPDSSLLPNTNYSVTISTQAKDVAGNQIVTPVNWSFSTLNDAKTTYDFSGYYTGQYISSATKQEGVSLVLLQPAGVSIPAGPGNPPNPPAVDIYATFIGNFSTDSGILGTIEGKVSGDAASVTVTYSKGGCTGTFSGSAVGLFTTSSSITMNFIGQACNGPEFVSIGVLQREP